MRFIGNQKIANFFDLAIKNGQLSQTCCFSGLGQVGKRTLANFLAAQILGVELEKLNTSADYHYLARLEDEKTGKKKKEISVEQVRELKEKLYQRSWSNGHKVAIVDEAELLNDESGNALLKVLEEPPQKCVIFLLTENDEKLLPTIQSRCQVFQFGTVSDEDIKNFLESLSVNAETIKKVINLSWGRPGRAKELAENPELLENFIAEKKRFERITAAPIYLRWKEMEEVLSEKGGQVKTKETLDPILDLWTMICREKMSVENSAVYAALIDSIFKIKNMLAANVNPKLAIEELLTKF